MADPSPPPRPRFADDEDAGFPPLRAADDVTDDEEHGADDRDYREEGGGD